MILIIHDLEEEQFNKLNINGDVVISPQNKISKCMGCFDCWIKNDGVCRINDAINNMKDLFKNADQVIVISKNTYGMFSPFVKNVFDRSIGYLSPYFRKVFGEVHHALRYDRKVNIEYIIYGNDNPNWKDTFDELLKANQENFNTEYSVKYLKEIEEYYE